MKHKKIIDKSSYKSIKSVVYRLCILYGLEKIHKNSCNVLPSFHLIISAIGKPIYNLVKILLQFLTPSTANEDAIIDSPHFRVATCQITNG